MLVFLFICLCCVQVFNQWAITRNERFNILQINFNLLLKFSKADISVSKQKGQDPSCLMMTVNWPLND